MSCRWFGASSSKKGCCARMRSSVSILIVPFHAGRSVDNARRLVALDADRNAGQVVVELFGTGKSDDILPHLHNQILRRKPAVRADRRGKTINTEKLAPAVARLRQAIRIEEE